MHTMTRIQFVSRKRLRRRIESISNEDFKRVIVVIVHGKKGNEPLISLCRKCNVPMIQLLNDFVSNVVLKTSVKIIQGGSVDVIWLQITRTVFLNENDGSKKLV